MARPNKGFTLYERPSRGLYYVRFTVAGKQVRVSTGVRLDEGRTKAQEAAAKLLVEQSRSASAPVNKAVRTLANGKLTMGEYLRDYYRDYVETSKREGRSERYVKRVGTDLSYVHRLWKHPREITTESWDAAKIRLHDRRICDEPGCQLKPECVAPKEHLPYGKMKWASIKHLLNTVRFFLRWAHDRGAIESVPELEAPNPKIMRLEKARKRPMTPDEKTRFLAALQQMGEDRAFRIYTTLFETWCRKSTLEQLTLGWCDFEREMITVPVTGHKGGSARDDLLEIDMTPLAARAISAEAEERGITDLDQPVFGVFDFGKKVKHRDGRRPGIFVRACELAGIDRTGIDPHHSTRRTAATMAGSRPGASIAALMSQGGWKTPSQVATYMKPSLAAARMVTREQPPPPAPGARRKAKAS